MVILSIEIGIDPNIVTLAGITISWLGVFIVMGIGAGSWLALRYSASDRVGLDRDEAYNLIVVVVACGIVGARLLYVVERYGDSSSLDSIVEIFAINEGGISIYGSLIGGAVGGWAYGLWRRLPCAGTADAAALGMLLGIAIGRIGDVINGEHISKATNLPWAVVYTHPGSPAYQGGPQHPVVAYEAIGALAILMFLLLLWDRQPKAGVTFVATFLLYATMRFFISFLRIDSEYPLFGLSTPQVVSLLVVIASLPLLVFFFRRPGPSVGGRASTIKPEAKSQLQG